MSTYVINLALELLFELAEMVALVLLGLQVVLGLLDDDGLIDLAEHEQQDDRPETATYAVEERQAECFNIATTTTSHVTTSVTYGQSLLTLMNDPPER